MLSDFSIENVTARIGESSLPTSPVAGGSWTAASAGAAVASACDAVKKTLFTHAKSMTNSPLAEAIFEDVEFRTARIARKDDAGRGLSIEEVMHAADLNEIVEDGSVYPDPAQAKKYVSYTHSAIFAEVRVDEDLGIVRVTKVVCATAGRPHS